MGLLIFVVAAALSIAVALRIIGTTTEEMVESLPRNVDFSLKQFSYSETRDGVTIWSLSADTASHTLESGKTSVDKIRMTFFDPKLGNLSLKSDLGEMDTREKTVAAQGDVRVESSRGYVLTTEALQYRDRDRAIFTDLPVRIASESLEVTGTGLHFDVASRSVSILSDVKARFVPVGKR